MELLRIIPLPKEQVVVMFAWQACNILRGWSLHILTSDALNVELW